MTAPAVCAGQIYLDVSLPESRRGVVVSVTDRAATLLWLCGSTTRVELSRLQGPAFKLEPRS